MRLVDVGDGIWVDWAVVMIVTGDMGEGITTVTMANGETVGVKTSAAEVVRRLGEAEEKLLRQRGFVGG